MVSFPLKVMMMRRERMFNPLMKIMVAPTNITIIEATNLRGRITHLIFL